MEILCFYAGIAFCYCQNFYPVSLVLTFLCFRFKSTYIFWFVSAILWGLLHQSFTADKGMPELPVIQRVMLQGYVASIPIQQPDKIQFQFFATMLNDQPIQANLLLSCYKNCPVLEAGQFLSLQAKLKKPRHLGNPGAFEYDRWLNSRHIHWVGTFYPQTLRILNPPASFSRLLEKRAYLAHSIERLDKDEISLGIIQALTLGLTHHINKAEWDLFRRTGTTHLIDISGEHIALIAGITYWLFKFFLKYTGLLCLRIPAPKIAGAGAMIVATLYTLIAGFAIPTQRSLISCYLFLLQYFLRQRFSGWQNWRYALFCVLLLEPHAIFMLGFYFSFLAVAILMITHQRLKYHGIRRIVSLQLACLLGLMPLSLYWFSYGSLNAFFANLIAIPWVGFVIVPLALIVVFLSPWVVVPGSIAFLKISITGLVCCLHFIDTLEAMNIHKSFTSLLPCLALMLAMFLLINCPIRRILPVTLLIIITSLFQSREKVREGHFRVDVLDVGQGLAVMIRTAHHALLYDTGMRLYHGSDMGKLAIIPYLNVIGLTHIDKVVISHPDLDHRGGLASLEATYNIRELIVNNPHFYHRGNNCHHYSDWQWDGVRFHFFPILQALPGKNNSSCILQVSNQSGQILLSGDIEKAAENYLVQQYGHSLTSRVLLVPHHGSKTSSSSIFLTEVKPQYAIASYGFDNRFHFPHPQTLKTYQRHRIPFYSTSTCGMIRLNFSLEKISISCDKPLNN